MHAFHEVKGDRPPFVFFHFDERWKTYDANAIGQIIVWTNPATVVSGLKLISKIPEGEVCNYLGIMATLSGPGNFCPHLNARFGSNREF